jgi:signal transduction histidine kinase/DNA-binding response OmpR family regulator
MFASFACFYFVLRVWFSDHRNKSLASFFAVGIDIAFYNMFSGVMYIASKDAAPFIYTFKVMAICVLPFVFFYFILFLIESPLLKSRFVRNCCIIIPLVDIFFLVTNPLHYNYFESYDEIFAGGFVFGTFGGIHMIIDYTVIGLSLVIFIHFSIKALRKKKAKPGIVFSGYAMLIPFGFNIIFSNIGFQYDLTAMGAFITFCIFFAVLYKNKLVSFKSALLTHIFESYQDCILLCDEDGIVKDANATLKMYFPTFKLVQDETTIGEFMHFLKESASEIEPENLLDDVQEVSEGQFVMGEGEEKKTYKFAVNHLEHRGDISVTISDVTEYLMLVDEVERQNEQLKELTRMAEDANKSKSQFLATMSHEIRTPMNAIIGISQMQMVRKDLPLDCIDAIGKIYTSGHGLLGIINDILDLSKIETGKLEILPIEYDLPSLINDTVQLNITRIGSKPIEFKLHISEQMPSILFGDELRIKQILNNIISNAIKYTEKGFVTMDVTFVKTDIGINLIIGVTDTGQGMKKEDLEKLGSEFARFNLNENRTTEGTGLGMSIAKRLIQLMNGKIDIQSEYGVGSSFTITIPQKVISWQIIGKELAYKLCNFTFSQSMKSEKIQIVREYMPYGKVLIVDDVETNLYVAEGLIRPYGITVETVTSGFAAIEKIEAGNVYDIIFMDHMMPQMDGIETTQKIRTMNYTAPIVALTANAIVGNDELFKSNGFDDFISKPIDIRQLNAVLNRYVRDKRKRGELPLAGNILIDLDHSESASNIPPKLIEVFKRDAAKAIEVLSQNEKTDLKLYITTVHAMKSACANLGNQELSELAKSLEAAGREGNENFITENTNRFEEQLKLFVATLSSKEESVNTLIAGDVPFLTETLKKLAVACDTYEEAEANQLLDTLGRYQFTDENRQRLKQISELLLHADFEEAGEMARSIAQNL